MDPFILLSHTLYLDMRLTRGFLVFFLIHRSHTTGKGDQGLHTHNEEKENFKTCTSVPQKSTLEKGRQLA